MLSVKSFVRCFPICRLRLFPFEKSLPKRILKIFRFLFEICKKDFAFVPFSYSVENVGLAEAKSTLTFPVRSPLLPCDRDGLSAEEVFFCLPWFYFALGAEEPFPYIFLFFVTKRNTMRKILHSSLLVVGT